MYKIDSLEQLKIKRQHSSALDAIFRAWLTFKPSGKKSKGIFFSYDKFVCMRRVFFFILLFSVPNNNSQCDETGVNPRSGTPCGYLWWIALISEHPAAPYIYVHTFICGRVSSGKRGPWEKWIITIQHIPSPARSLLFTRFYL